MLKSFEKQSEAIPGKRFDSTIQVDQRCYKRGMCAKQRRIRISIFRKTAYSVELTPEDAIEFFERGIEYARAMQAES